MKRTIQFILLISIFLFSTSTLAHEGKKKVVVLPLFAAGQQAGVDAAVYEGDDTFIGYVIAADVIGEIWQL